MDELTNGALGVRWYLSFKGPTLMISGHHTKDSLLTGVHKVGILWEGHTIWTFFWNHLVCKDKKKLESFFKFIWPSQNILTLQGSLAGATKATYAVVNVRTHWGN